MTPRIDQTRVALLQLVGSQAEAIEHGGQEVGQEDVGLVDETQQRGSTTRGLQVKRDALLVAVRELERVVDGTAADAGQDEAAIAVATDRVLDLDDLGAPVGEQRTGHRNEDPLRELDDANALERGRHARVGSVGVKRNNRSALPRRILRRVSAGNSCSSLWATSSESGHVVSECG